MSVMISPSGLATMDATRFDAMGFETSIDLKSIGEAEARVLMSAEHKALGYRPPAGSLAAEAQAAAAKNPTPARRIPEDQLTQAALEDAIRIKKEREVNGVDITTVSEAHARQLVSEELKVLGHRPLPDSFMSQSQVAAANNPPAVSQLPSLALQRAALDDLATLGGVSINIDLDFIGQAEARRLMSEEHKALGYRPPQGSLAAAAQAAAAKHPHASAGLDPVTLARAALVDAKKIEAKRRSLSASSDTKPELNFDTATTVATSEVHTLQTDEQKTPGFRPLPPDSIAALVQSFVEKRATETTTKEAVANQNEVDGGSRTFGEAGL